MILEALSRPFVITTHFLLPKCYHHPDLKHYIVVLPGFEHYLNKLSSVYTLSCRASSLNFMSVGFIFSVLTAE